MTESGESNPNPSSNPASSQSGRGRSRRGRRGGRGRGRGPRPSREPAAEAPGEVKTSAQTAGQETYVDEGSESRSEHTGHSDAEPVIEEQVSPPAQAPEAGSLVERVANIARRVTESEPEFRGSAISRAIDEVTDVIEALKKAVDQMEEVLELVEVAERQKLADEREIEALRRQLRQLHGRGRDRQDRGSEERENH